MTNLLEETVACIKNSGHYIEDIIYIGNREGYSCTWDDFVKIADADYDSGFGGAEVATDLIIVFKDNIIMSRGEYDGSEWWEYNVPFEMPETLYPIAKVIGDGYWIGLKEINNN